MANRGERSLVLFAMIFVFTCLLLSGGSRLIAGGERENATSVRPVQEICTALVSMPAPAPQSGLVRTSETTLQRFTQAPAPESVSLSRIVLCDANGNVLGGQTYLHAVYQAFVLDDGFV